MSNKTNAGKERSPSRPAPVRPKGVSPGGLWFAPETIAAMEAMRAKAQAENAPAGQSDTASTTSPSAVG